MPETDQPKPGIKSTEFWLTFAAQIAAALIATVGENSLAGVILSGVSASAYAVTRGLAKVKTEGSIKPGKRTTEFWISFAAQALALVVGITGDQTTAGVIIAAVSNGAYQVSRGMAKMGTTADTPEAGGS